MFALWMKRSISTSTGKRGWHWHQYYCPVPDSKQGSLYWAGDVVLTGPQLRRPSCKHYNQRDPEGPPGAQLSAASCGASRSPIRSLEKSRSRSGESSVYRDRVLDVLMRLASFGGDHKSKQARPPNLRSIRQGGSSGDGEYQFAARSISAASCDIGPAGWVYWLRQAPL
jgi:hypothetical protein